MRNPSSITAADSLLMILDMTNSWLEMEHWVPIGVKYQTMSQKYRYSRYGNFATSVAEPESALEHQRYLWILWATEH